MMIDIIEPTYLGRLPDMSDTHLINDDTATQHD
jgi:hypothetical protein